MRIGIDYRILAVGRHLIRRGMGRYTQQQLRAVLALDRENEYVLLCGPGAGSDTSQIDPAILAAPNTELRHLPSSTQRAHDDDRATTLERAEAFQAWVATLGLDVFHATAPFLSAEPFLSTFDACPMVATLYDLIPLHYPGHYLATAADRDAYLFALSLVRRATGIIAISDATRRDAALHLGINASEVEIAYPIVDACFHPMTAEEVGQTLAPLTARARIPERFAMTVSFPHHSKNLETLLHAYSLLAPEIRLQLPLVVCCLLDPKGARPVWDMADRLGIADDLVLTGLVTDDELAALYNQATFLVHPSRYEGFGLPVAEAMRCGTPVITTTSSSLPEVGGDAAILVDPDDVDGMAAAMGEVLMDEDRRLGMSARGAIHSQRFGAEQLGRATLAAYQRAEPGPGRARTGPPRPRVAMWTPLPPIESGVADTVAELLDSLAEPCDVEVFVDDGVVPPPALLGRQPVHHFSAFARREEHDGFDAVVYQMGASVLHLYIYGPLQHHPGITVLHDLPWSYVLYADANRRDRPEEFRAELAELEGEGAAAELAILEGEAAADGRELADTAALDFWARHPMLGRMVESSTATIVHAESGAAEVAARYPGASVTAVRLGVGDPYEGWPDPASARKELGLDPSTFCIGVFGIVHPSKRIEACIRALPDVVADDRDVLLLVVGRVLDPTYEHQLRRLAASLGVTNQVRFTGPVTFEEFLAFQIASDVVVNLRSPMVKQWSGTLMRGLAAAKPVVISDVPYWRSLPDDVCPRVTTGAGEVAELVEVLRSLRADDDRRAALSSRARAYFDENGTVARMAAGYLDVIEGVIGSGIVRECPERVADQSRWDELVRGVLG
jgi:glycosyltransferase involved in cell wall biosynthesis